MKIGISSIVTAFNARGVIGSKVLDDEGFLRELEQAVAQHNHADDREPGQHFVHLGDSVNSCVSAGVGKRPDDIHSYLNRKHRGRYSTFLKRGCAAPVEGCACIVYTIDAYASDPEVPDVEAQALRHDDVTHVIVAVLAFAGPEAPLTPHRFVANLAGGNKEAFGWSAEEIRSKAEAIAAYDDVWCVVAD